MTGGACNRRVRVSAEMHVGCFVRLAEQNLPFKSFGGVSVVSLEKA